MISKRLDECFFTDCQGKSGLSLETGSKGQSDQGEVEDNYSQQGLAKRKNGGDRLSQPDSPHRTEGSGAGVEERGTREPSIGNNCLLQIQFTA